LCLPSSRKSHGSAIRDCPYFKLANETFESLAKLAKESGPRGQKAKRMLKLIKEGGRLSQKIKGKP